MCTDLRTSTGYAAITTLRSARSAISGVSGRRQHSGSVVGSTPGSTRMRAPLTSISIAPRGSASRDATASRELGDAGRLLSLVGGPEPAVRVDPRRHEAHPQPTLSYRYFWHAPADFRSDSSATGRNIAAAGPLGYSEPVNRCKRFYFYEFRPSPTIPIAA